MAFLSHYIESCYNGNTDFPPISMREKAFDQGIMHNPPRLLKEQKNRILLYPGAFNPPHHGHMELLATAFTFSRDINVIAAIIIPLSDAYVQQKSLVAGDGLAFTLEERARLWRGHVPHDWYWVYDRGEDNWELFRREIEACVTGDGFELEFVVILGSDYIGKDKRPPWNNWGCKSLITSNVSRPANFLTSDKLDQLRDCEAWGRVVWDCNFLRKFIVRQGSFMAGAMALLTPTAFLEDPQRLQIDLQKLHQAEVDRMRDVSLCCRRGHSDETIRFIRSEEGGATLSSTHIRRELTSDRARTTPLNSMVLHMDILAEIMLSKTRARTGI